MISTSEAFSILENLNYSKRVVELSLLEARNHVLAETVYSPINMPPFRQATMDGFAIALHDSLQYEIVGEVKAGDFFTNELKPGQAVKIFTGAAVPNSAQAVIQIEKVSVTNSDLFLQENIKPETNIRQLGAQITKDAVALEEGTFLNPAAIGFLTGLGITKVKVFQKPSVGIVVTGNELISAGENLPNGKVYESNTIMLQTALFDANFNTVSLYKVNDDFENTKSTLKKAINENDVVLVSGGISVGDYDFVGKALESLEVETLFYKVNQKPGKPLLVGKQNDKLIFALPGNPAASLTCFYVYVLPTLQRRSGIKHTYGSQLKKSLAHDFTVDNPRSQFLKAFIVDDEVTILSHQDSGMLNSFALANALVYVPNGNYQLSKGDKVSVYLI
ncbi:molybdopterin molybdotransferase MoeA [Flavobacterium sangjuense]|uniref:Molybdopterin molybdenumtransferase n=1 Tax=Flavobacterium sangjuense TaxID=2518177 RepID=A0A4P7PTF8_9FLAO|nr:molybdopterin molybdotransferase MoeA [Flavobacterium sangjuense]QBZ97966.1 Molybdopterin molybdenumtransferase [Flavobacterium sangjuense]